MSATRQNAVISSSSGAGGNVNFDLEHVNATEAAKLMSEEHKMLTYRPPAGSLAAQAQAAAARHPNAPGAVGGNVQELRRLAKDDVARIQAQRSNASSVGGQAQLEVGGIGKALASKIQLIEHKALGYRPSARSLAAKGAQRAADKALPADSTQVADATVKDAQHVAGDSD